MRPTSGVLGPAWERAAGGAASTWSRRPLHGSSQGWQLSLGRLPRISAGAFLGHTGGDSCRCQWRWVKAGPGVLPGTREERDRHEQEGASSSAPHIYRSRGKKPKAWEFPVASGQKAVVLHGSPLMCATKSLHLQWIYGSLLETREENLSLPKG